MPFPFAGLRSSAVESNSLVNFSFPLHCYSTWLSHYQLPSTPYHPTLLILWKQRLQTSRSPRTSDHYSSCTQQACCYTAWYSIRASDLGEWARPIPTRSQVLLMIQVRSYWFVQEQKPIELSMQTSVSMQIPDAWECPQASSIKKCLWLRSEVLPCSVDWANYRYFLLN